MTQTVILATPPVGRPGMIADSSLTDVLTKAATASTAFGLFVCRNDAGDLNTEIKVPAASADVTARGLGILMEDLSSPAGPRLDGDICQVATMGRIWVQVEAAVTAGMPLFVRHAAGGLGLGAMRGDAAANFVAFGRGVFETSAAANGLAILDLSK